MMSKSLTEQAIRDEAAKYKTRSEFKKNSGAVYEQARTKYPGLVQSIFAVDARAQAGVKRRKWTKEKCLQEALKYRTKVEFDKASTACQYARKHGFLDEICGHMVCGLKIRSDRNRKWTEVAIRKAAADCLTKGEFFKKHTAAARAAQKLGIYDDICANFPALRETWTPELITRRAAKHESLAAFYKEDPRAYEAMLRYDLVNTAGAHLRRRDPSDMDTIYFWEAVGERYNGKRVCKIGLTSQRCGDTRIVDVANQAGMEHRLLVARFLGKWYVPELEKYLLTFGEDPKLDVPDGKTEFRALTDEEVSTIIRVIESHPIL
jgi:hypothetical protein